MQDKMTNSRKEGQELATQITRESPAEESPEPSLDPLIFLKFRKFCIRPIKLLDDFDKAAHSHPLCFEGQFARNNSPGTAEYNQYPIAISPSSITLNYNGLRPWWTWR